MRRFGAPRAPEPKEAGGVTPEDGQSAPGSGSDTEPRVVGERGISSINRARSLQSRVTNLLAFALMSALGVGLLGWYYAHTFAAESTARGTREAAVRQQASGTLRLPPLGPIRPPAIASGAKPSLVASALGPPPPPPSMPGSDPVMLAGYPQGAPAYGGAATPVGGGRSPRELALERELAGPAFDTNPTNASSTPTGESEYSPPGTMEPAETGGLPSPPGFSGTGAPRSRLGALLTPTVTRTARPTVLPTRRLLLPEGAFINCTLETAIDSTLPGMTTCITATDTFGADGTVVLLPRGTELVGETRGQVQQGSARVFVLWTEARTPGGVVIPLDSPGTDALGRSGLTGTVNRHFWERFGAAILISVINGGIQYGVQSQNQGGALVYEPDTTEGVMTEALKSTVDIPPTVAVPNGARIQVFVARNIDFRSVYALRPTRE